MDQWAELGKERAARHFAIKPGSGAVNASVALAKLGLQAGLITTIGQNPEGRLLYDMIGKTGVDMSMVCHNPDCRTSVSAALGYQGDRGFVSYFADADVQGERACFTQVLTQTKLVHLSLSDCVRHPCAALAKQSGVMVTIDSGWDEMLNRDAVAPILADCDLFFTNMMEAEHIFGSASLNTLVERIARHIDVFVIKLGKGSLLHNRGQSARIPPIEAGPPVEMTGAGDLYCAGFLYGLLNGWAMDACARFASASGGVGVTFYGGVDDAYTLARVRQAYDAQGPV